MNTKKVGILLILNICPSTKRMYYVKIPLTERKQIKLQKD